MSKPSKTSKLAKPLALENLKQRFVVGSADEVHVSTSVRLGNKRVRRAGKLENPLKTDVDTHAAVAGFAAGGGFSARPTKPVKLTASQLVALDHLVGMGGEAFGGNAMCRDSTARSLRKRGLVEAVKGPESNLFTKWRITEQGRAERARAHAARKERHVTR